MKINYGAAAVAIAWAAHAANADRRLKVARTDPLTGLSGRAGFVRDATRMANRDDTLLMFFDLDKFKEVNDTNGHHIGDALLQAVAARLINATSERAVVARLGGDEFVVAAPNQPDDETLGPYLQSVWLTITGRVQIGEDRWLTPGVSIGAFVAPKGCPLTIGLKLADAAMYEAKTNQCNWCVADLEDLTAPRRWKRTQGDLSHPQAA